jgi:hypothetical protein
MSPFGLRVALRTVFDALADVARLGFLTPQSRESFAPQINGNRGRMTFFADYRWNSMPRSCRLRS